MNGTVIYNKNICAGIESIPALYLLSLLLVTVLVIIVLSLFLVYYRKRLRKTQESLVRYITIYLNVKSSVPPDKHPIVNRMKAPVTPDEFIQIINRMLKRMMLLPVFILAAVLPLSAQETAAEKQPTENAAASPENKSDFSLRFNLLRWATLTPDLGVEVYIGKKFSVAADGCYGMWDYSHTHGSLATWSIGGEARYWLQTRQYGFRRTYIGLSVRGGEYDLYNAGKGRCGEKLSAGITAGYRFILRGNWYFDAGLGLGYIHTRYDKYTWNKRFGKYEFNEERTRNIFGLTNLHASLVYRFPAKKK